MLIDNFRILYFINAFLYFFLLKDEGEGQKVV